MTVAYTATLPEPVAPTPLDDAADARWWPMVELRERYGLGWKKLADAVRGTPDAQSSIRRKYQSGLRYLGRTDSGPTDA
ncbi:hypothetical protein ACWD45_26105 [Streptomyces rubiginosohelvolus]